MRANTNKLALNRAEDVTGELKAKHVNVQEHTIFVDGTELYERREMEIISDGPSEGQLILKHTRRIDGQEYTRWKRETMDNSSQLKLSPR